MNYTTIIDMKDLLVKLINHSIMALIGLNIVTWNITGIMSSAAYLSNVLSDGNIDICGISEHWLLPCNVHFMDTILTDYNHFTICSNTEYTKSSRATGKGGVAIIWKKQVQQLDYTTYH